MCLIACEFIDFVLTLKLLGLISNIEEYQKT